MMAAVPQVLLDLEGQQHPDDDLLGDLCAPKWRLMSGGKILIESKDDIRKRIGRSTDVGDAVVYASGNKNNFVFL